MIDSSNIHIIKVYWHQYLSYRDNIGEETRYGVEITPLLRDAVLKRLLTLLEREWSDGKGH